MSSRPRSDLVRAADLGALDTAARALTTRFSANKYVGDPAHIGSLVDVSVPIAKEDTPAYDIVIVGNYYSFRIPPLLPNVFLCQEEEQLDVS